MYFSPLGVERFGDRVGVASDSLSLSQGFRKETSNLPDAPEKKHVGHLMSRLLNYPLIPFVFGFAFL